MYHYPNIHNSNFHYNKLKKHNNRPFHIFIINWPYFLVYKKKKDF